MNFKEKIDKLLIISPKKINSVHELEKQLGLGMNTLRKAYNDNREPSRKTIWKLLEFLDVNQHWWETGKGEIFTEKHTGVAESPLTYEATEISRDVTGVRVVEIKAQAGYLRGYADQEYMETLPTIPVSKEVVRGGNFLCFTVNGDSLDDGTRRSICHGDVVLGRELAKHHWKNKLHFTRVLFIIVHKTEGICFKEITAHNPDTGEITCHSFNPLYEDFTLNLKDVTQLFYIKKIVERNINF